MRQRLYNQGRCAPTFEPMEPRLLLSGDVVISEFMTFNNRTLADADGDYSDWIEIQNVSAAAVNLKGWHLTNDAAKPELWHFPSSDLWLNAGARMVIYASDKNRTSAASQLHTNFTLPITGGYVALVQPDGVTVSSEYAAYPEQRPDISYGRVTASTQTLVSAGGEARYLVPGDDTLGLDWTTRTFDDSTWTTGTTALGYDTTLPPASPGAGTFYFAPFGTGGTWNLYQLVSTNRTWIQAYNDAKALTQGGQTGHLVTIHSAAENVFVQGIISGDSWIGLTDSGTFASLGAYEAGNTSGNPLPLDGQVPGSGQRGRGFVWVTGEPFTWQNWKSSQPNESGGQDAVRIEKTGAVWNDDKSGEAGQTGVSKPYVVEYELNLPSLGPNWTVLEAHSGSAVTGIAGAVTLLAGGGTTYYRPWINFADPQNPDGGRLAGNIPFSGDTAADDNNFAIRASGTIKVATAGAYTFLVNSDDGFRLQIAGATFSSVTGTGTTIAGDTMERAGTGAGESLGVVTLAAGEYRVDLTYFDNTAGAQVELLAAPGSKTAWDSTFKLVGDSMNGGLPLVDVADRVTTDLRAAMQGVNSSLYLRSSFMLTDPADIASLVLNIRYDDGFAVYLNNTLVASRNAPAMPVWNSAATAGQSDLGATTWETIDLTAFRGALHMGTNVLAIHALNAGAADGDFLIQPELVATMGALSQYYATPTPGSANLGAVLPIFMGDTHFNVDRGFYSTAFDLVVTCDTPGAVIRYTLDGSLPTATRGLDYTGPITLSTTTVVRAAAFQAGYLPSNVDTQTYLFVADVLDQTRPAGYPTSWMGYAADYDMDPEIVNDPQYASLMLEAMTSIPTISIVMNVDDMFGTRGLYTNSSNDEAWWERPTSVELIYADGTKGFQADAGIQIQGGSSRLIGKTPKHPFRLVFKGDYGETELHYDLFGGEATADFDTLTLRAGFNNSWTHWEAAQRQRAQFVRDQWAHDTQQAMGWASPSTTYVHLYINGIYWGLYNPTERPDEHFAAEYLGGIESEYDVLQGEEAGPQVVAGTRAAWDAMTAILDDPNRTIDQKYQDVQAYLDLDNFIDYMILNFYGGNQDWDQHNWYAVRNQNGGRWQFVAWDSERILEGVNDDVTEFDKTVGGTRMPSHFHAVLRASAEYRLRFADRVQRLFFNGGALYVDPTSPQYDPAHPERNVPAARWMARAAEIDLAVIGESARWGDYRRDVYPYSGGPYNLYTRNGYESGGSHVAGWIDEQTRLLTTYFPYRSANVLAQFRADGLYPTISAPSYSQHGGAIASGYRLTITNANTSPTGTVYYTLDGTDPRLAGGAVTPGARTYTGPVTLTAETVVRSRVLRSGVWSALDEATFTLATPPAVRITELMYHPVDPPTGSPYTDTDFQYIELTNFGTAAVALQNMRFIAGIDFTFPDITLAAGQRVLVVKNPAAFASRYDTSGMLIAGQFVAPTDLSKNSERLQLVTALGATIHDFSYSDGWFPLTDGTGFSLVARDPAQDLALWDSKSGWRMSWAPNGNPGLGDPGQNPGSIVFNELLAHTDGPDGDWVELRNTTGAAISIGGWYLSDDAANLLKFRIADGTTIGVGECYALTQAQHFGTQIAFSELGGSVYLTSAPSAGVAGGYREDESFGASPAETSFGRYIKSTGGKDFVFMSAITRGQTNAYPLVGPVVINEVMYQPLSGSEWIELYNLSDQTAYLYDPARPANTWKFTNAFEYVLPQGLTIPGGGYLVIALPAASLVNTGATIELMRPGDPEPGTGFAPYYRVDRLTYDNEAPWPTSPDGGGPSLEREQSALYGNDVINWAAGPVGGTPNGVSGTIPPWITAIRYNGRDGRGPSDIDPSGRGIRTIEITFSEVVTFGVGSVFINRVSFPGGVESLGASITPASVTGTGTTKMTITLTAGVVQDTWVKVVLKGNGTLTDLSGRPLDGEARAGGSGLGYLFDAALDLPTGDRMAGGDAVFYVGSLRGDFSGPAGTGPDGQLTPEDVLGFQAAYAARDLDADFRGVGFGVRPSDGRITVGDIDGFTAAYQSGTAVGRRLTALPGSGGLLATATLEPAMPAPVAAQAPAASSVAGVGAMFSGAQAILPASSALVVLQAEATVAPRSSSVPPADRASDPAADWWLAAVSAAPVLPSDGAAASPAGLATADLSAPVAADAEPLTGLDVGVDWLLDIPALAVPLGA